MAGNQGNNRIVWTEEMLSWLKANWKDMTAQQLADGLGLKRTIVRTKLYELGLKKIELEYWTPEQITFLKSKYRTIGDMELAELFSDKWKKDKGWTNKHIAKKRRQMGLKRTKAEVAAIKVRNKVKGRWAMCATKRWETIGQAPEGEIRRWFVNGVPRLHIKIRGRWRSYTRWFYEKNIGPIPRGGLVRVIDGDPCNVTVDNLELIKRSAHGPKNKKQTPQYKRTRLKAIIKTQIQRNEKQIKRSEQSSFRAAGAAKR